MNSADRDRLADRMHSLLLELDPEERREQMQEVVRLFREADLFTAGAPSSPREFVAALLRDNPALAVGPESVAAALVAESPADLASWMLPGGSLD